MKLTRGATSRSVSVYLGDARSNAAAGLTGLAYNSAGLVCTYKADTAASPTVVTLVTASVGTWTSGGVKEIDATNAPGWYELGLPNAALATGKLVTVELHGAANQVPASLTIELDALDYQAANLPADVQAVKGSSTTAENLQYCDFPVSNVGGAAAAAVAGLLDARHLTQTVVDEIATDAGSAATNALTAAGKATTMEADYARRTDTLRAVDTDGTARLATAGALASVASTLGTLASSVAGIPAGVWAVLTSTLTTAGSVGKGLLDYLTGIKAKTENLPADPASASDVSLTISPLAAQSGGGDPRSQRIEASQGSAPLVAFTCVDRTTGAAIDLSAKTVRFVAATETLGAAAPYTGLFQYQTGGSGVTIGGTAHNVAAVQFAAADTGTYRTLNWWLWNITDNQVLAKGVLDVVPAAKAV